MPSQKLTHWVLERRYTGDLNVALFYEALGNWSRRDMARKIHLNDPQRFGIWSREGRLPWAVYLALLDKLGTPKFHQAPTLVTATRPVRLPPEFEKYLAVERLEPPAPPAAEVVPAIETPKVEPIRAEIVIRIELVNAMMAPTPAEPLPSPAALALPDVAASALARRERELTQRIQDLELQLADERARHLAQSRPTSERPDKPTRHLLRNVAKHDPNGARDLGKSLLTARR